MYLCLFEDERIDHLRPLVDTRAVYDLRLGLRTILETTRDAFAALTGGREVLLHTRPVLAAVTAQEHDALVNRIPGDLGVLFVNGRFVAEDGPLLDRFRAAAGAGEPGRVFVQGDEVVAAWVPAADRVSLTGGALTRATFDGLAEERIEGAQLVGRLWHLIEGLRPALERDFRARTKGREIYERPGALIADGVHIVNGADVFVGAGAVVRPGALLNAEAGPIYIAAEAVVMEGAVIRGPAYVGPKGQVKVQANIEGVALGPWCKVGGEVHDSVLHSLSNKAHVGFLGHAYLGRWCNIGAGTNNSDLKNDYGPVSLYNVALGDFEDSGQQFLGLFMGDHAKCGINMMLNTGTVVGTFCNVYGTGFPPRYLPAFSWGSPADGFTEYRLDKALCVAEAVMARRDASLTDAERALLKAVSDAARADRAA